MKSTRELIFATDLARDAGQIMTENFNSENMGVAWKADNSPVTTADTAINTMVIERVKKIFPNDGVIGEEESYNVNAERKWVTDPLDGTIPYMVDIPASTFCIAAVKNGIVEASVVYDPFQDQMFQATRGGGALLNGRKLKVSDQEGFKAQCFSLSVGSINGSKDISRVRQELKDKGARVLDILSFALMGTRVATGKLQAAFMNYGSPWDAAAVSLIVEEAGGRATDLNGKPRRYDEYGDGIVLSNGLVHDQILKMIANARNRN